MCDHSSCLLDTGKSGMTRAGWPAAGGSPQRSRGPWRTSQHVSRTYLLLNIVQYLFVSKQNVKNISNIFLIFLLFFPSKDCSGLINIGHFQKEAASQWRCKTKITCNNSLPYAQGKLFINGFNEYKIVLTFIYFQCVYYLRDSATSTSNVKIFPKLAPSSSNFYIKCWNYFFLGWNLDPTE